MGKCLDFLGIVRGPLLQMRDGKCSYEIPINSQIRFRVTESFRCVWATSAYPPQPGFSPRIEGNGKLPFFGIWGAWRRGCGSPLGGAFAELLGSAFAG